MFGPNFKHSIRIAQINRFNTQPISNILFGIIDLHAFCELHPQYQISGGANTTHAGRNSVRNFKAESIAYAYLQSVGLADFNQRFISPGHNIDRWYLGHRNAANAHADINMNRDLCRFGAGFYESDCPGDVPWE
jgi:hypothetical protein